MSFIQSNTLLRVDSNKSDILIIDDEGSSFIIECIPDRLKYSIVKVREGIPYIAKPAFLFRLFARVLQFGLKNKALISAIVDVISPKVIISYIDNSPIMGELSVIFPNRIVISVQNVTRMYAYVFLDSSGDFRLPYYFSFGNYEKKIAEKYNIKYKEIYATGSLKTSIFLKNHNHSIENNKSICLISQHWSNTSDKTIIDYMEKIKRIYLNLISWSDKRNYEVKIAMRNKKSKRSSYKDEVNFYNENDTYRKVELIPNTNFSSYKAGYESSIIITMDSTLGFELLGLGKKVLFCAKTIEDTLKHKENINYIFCEIPEMLLLDGLTQHEFNNKIDALINMEGCEYLKQTEGARKYYMNFNKLPVYKVISNFICEKIDNNKINYDTRNR